MTVYVDDVSLPYGRMTMCHMWADSLPELLAMADMIGVARRWLQEPPRASWTHFDIALSKKALALAAGAILTDRFGPAEHVARLDMASYDAGTAAAGVRRLAQVEAARGRRTGEG